MVVRFEVDACLAPAAAAGAHSRAHPTIDDLAENLSAVSMAETRFDCEYPLIIREGGSEISFDSVIEMTTRSEYTMANGFNWQEAYPQLFFSKTSNHYLAIHNRGTFNSIEKRNTSSKELQKVEKELQPQFQKTRKALDLIRNVVVAHGKKGRLSLVCMGGVMKVYQRSSDESLLPSEVMQYFESD